jgi:uncharacterized surface protein with fasciclin (FAS1) repeats
MKTIIETASENKDFSTLVMAIKAAGLVDTLNGTGPFTVFAPTNAAFAKIPESTLQDLLKDKPKLTSILTYHVLRGKVLAKDIVTQNGAKTIEGGTLTITTTTGVMVNDATVSTTDIECDNGVIHAIDTVLMPS